MTTPTGSLAATPPMGWNPWNMFGNAIDEASIRATAQALVSSGQNACGYNYVVFDFLKYDYYHAPSDQATAIDRCARMGRALRKAGREFLYSLCEWGGRSLQPWGRRVGGHKWRVSGDVFDSWANVWVAAHKFYSIGVDVSLDIAAHLDEYGGPGGWNDLDRLVVGLRGKRHIWGNGMSFVEYQTHMSLWCLA